MAKNAQLSTHQEILWERRSSGSKEVIKDPLLPLQRQWALSSLAPADREREEARREQIILSLPPKKQRTKLVL
jgi:hypothetical protein